MNISPQKKAQSEILKEVKHEYLFSEQTLTLEECQKLYESKGGNPLDLAISDLKEIMLTDNWMTRRGELLLKQEQALYSARQKRFLSAKLRMDEKVLTANENLIDVAIERLQEDNKDNLRISDLERLSNTVAKAQATNNEIIGSALDYNKVSGQIQAPNEVDGSVDLSALPDSVIRQIIAAQKGK